MDGSTRGDALRRGAMVAGGALAAVTAAGLPGMVGAQSRKRDAEVLNLLLRVEFTEAAFYTAALADAGLTGELQQYAQTVLRHEKAHVEALRGALGSAAKREPKYDFGAALADADAFAETAARLEDIAVAAYNGQAANVSEAAFGPAARIVSVEARHAAWIRSLQGRPPAPDATDKPQNERQVREALRKIGVTG